MSEDDIQEFMNITLQDRRTAMYCLQRHNGNLNLAISYYFDNSYRINIPPDFMNGNNSSTTNSQSVSTTTTAAETQAHSPLEEFRRLTRMRAANNAHDESPPPANPPTLNARLARDLTRYKKSDPSLFIPYGIPKKEEPIHFDDFSVKMTNEEITNSEKLFSCIECECVKCVVYKDGILINSKFYPKSDANCKLAMKQIKKNLLPTALIPDMGEVDFEVDFKKTKYHD